DIINTRRSNNSIGIDKFFGVRRMAQINSVQSPVAAQIADDAKTVTEVIGDEQSVAIRTDGQPGGIDGRVISVVARRGCIRRKAAHVYERSGDCGLRAGRGWRNRRLYSGLKAKDPDLVFESTRRKQRIRAVGFRYW